MTNRKPTGYVIYEGASLIDGAPIVCIATIKSRNSKTANMVQTWIMRSDIDPITANRIGADRSICGDCPHRGIAQPKAKRGLAANRSCYVTIVQAPRSIWSAYKRGRYPVASGHQAIAAIGRNRMVRIGAYGDGAAIPAYVTESLTSEAKGHTAYSHQSGNASTSFDPSRYMISADTRESANAAWSKGWRTFRVLRPGETPVRGKEIVCPSLKGIHCVDCGLCAGASKQAKSIAIPAHGNGASNFN
jgi:hypothetical protein